MRHQDLTFNHRLESWVFANAAARNTAGAYVSSDVGRIAYQQDNGSYWRLTVISPLTWAALQTLPTVVTSVFGRTGAVVATTNDYSYAQLSGTPVVPSVFGRVGAIVAAPNDYSYSQLSGTPVIPSVFGRTGAIVAATNDYSYAQLSGKPVYASIQTTASSPSATATGTPGIMLGLGSTAHFAPTASGKIFVTVSGTLTSYVASHQANAYLRWGTGTGPAYGASGNTGTVVGGATGVYGGDTVETSGFSLSGLLTGRALGTQVWFDLQIWVDSGGNGQALSVAVTAMEIP